MLGGDFGAQDLRVDGLGRVFDLYKGAVFVDFLDELKVRGNFGHE